MMKFSLGDLVTITVSGEQGEVVGRAQYSNAPPCYLIRYVRKDGIATEAWWTQDALS